MKVLKFEIDNLYMYNNFVIDFTHPRKVKNIFRESEKCEVSNINVNDINIIIGSNASGKTALGKCLLMVQSLIRGNNVKDILTKNRDQERLASLLIEYVVTDIDGTVKRDYFFRYVVEFTDSSIESEKLSYFKLTKGNSYNSALFKLIYEYKRTSSDDDVNYGDDNVMQSNIFTNYKESLKVIGKKDELYLLYLASRSGYSYAYSDSCFGKISDFNLSNEDIIKAIERFIIQVDPRIEKLEEVIVNDEYDKSTDVEFKIYYKNTKNGTYVNINKHHPRYIDLMGELSSGTIEALAFFIQYLKIRQGKHNTIFVDEQLTHIHFELEKELLTLLVSALPEDVQLFYTSHNPEVMKMNIPLVFYYIMYKDEDGFQRVIRPSEYLVSRNDRNELYEKVMHDYFNTSLSFDFSEFYD